MEKKKKNNYINLFDFYCILFFCIKKILIIKKYIIYK